MKTFSPVTPEVELHKAFVSQVDENIIQLKFKNDVNFELRDAIEANKVVYSMTKGKPFLSLIDARVYGTITSDAREFFAKDTLTQDTRIAEAFVINNLSTRLYVRFYMRLNKPANPTRVFSDIKDAKIWLKLQFKQKYGNIDVSSIAESENFQSN